MLSTMSRCADYFQNFQNGCHCHGNGQNAKKLKNTKMIIAGYWPFWIQNGRHSKPSMNINLQHHNLLGNQISSKAEEFCTLDTMATATILNFFNTKWPPK
jgi:hypothetical protein